MIVDLLARAKSGEGVKSGPLGLAVILVLCVAVYFLFKSMSKHLRKVREGFPTDERTPTPEPVEKNPPSEQGETQPPAATRSGDGDDPPS